MLVYVRPSNEHILIVRVPGAQDQRGCPSHHFHRARSVSKEGTWPFPAFAVVLSKTPEPLAWVTIGEEGLGLLRSSLS